MSSQGERLILALVPEVAIPFLLRAITPLHPGSGVRISGLVDLPVQKETHTELPIIYGSSLKGALRAWARAKNMMKEEDVREIFGSNPKEKNKVMGKAVFTDAKLLLLPVYSLKGIYGWITSPFLISRFMMDLEMAELITSEGGLPRRGVGSNRKVEISVERGNALISRTNAMTIKLEDRQVVVVEDMVLNAAPSEGALAFLDELGELGRKVRDRTVVVSDDDFMRLMRRAISVSPHIVINPATGTASNLWFQEDLPAETVLYSVVFSTRKCEGKLKDLLSGVVHIGGDITTGLGFAEVILLGEES